MQPDYRIDPNTRIQGKQITFDDLVPLAMEILESNRYARGALRQTYSHVFLDEFQDATRNQYLLVKAAFLDTDVVLTAVGDVKQRIMALAGALDGIMKTFADDFEAASLTLYQNFRSAPRLRRMQNRMIEDMDPAAASPDEDLLGDDGVIQVLHFDSQVEEAVAVADLIDGWLEAGHIAKRDRGPGPSTVQTRDRGACGGTPRSRHPVPQRTGQPRPGCRARCCFDLQLRVGGGRRPATRCVRRTHARCFARKRHRRAALQFDSRLKRLLRETRAAVRSPWFARGDLTAWRPVITEFLEVVSRPALNALSPAYQQGARLDEVIEDAHGALGRELAVDGDPVEALKRLSELDAVRILTIHKCKGLEFEKVVVLGVEEELFWGDAAHLSSSSRSRAPRKNLS